MISWNNAVALAGCGVDGEPLCRQAPDPDVSCQGLHHWTADYLALHSECLNLDPTIPPGTSKPLAPHEFRRNAFNRSLTGAIAVAEKERLPVMAMMFAAETASDPTELERRFKLPSGSPLATGGCIVSYKPGFGLSCTGRGAAIGAMLPSGARYDLDLPFGFPFEAALARATKRP